MYAVLYGDEWWSVIPLTAAMVSAPLWPLVARFSSRSAPERARSRSASYFQLTIVLWGRTGALLLAVFVGVFVLVAAVAAEIGFSFDSTRRVLTGRPVAAPRRTIHFVK